MIRRIAFASAIVASLGAVAPLRTLEGQVETQVALDTAGRIETMTPQLATRLGLGLPEWLVGGRFERARLYQTGDSFVLVVERGNGVVERIAMTPEQVTALRRLITERAHGGGRRGVGEQRAAISQPAGTAFVIHQSLLGFFVYGPAAAVTVGSSSEDGAAAALAQTFVAGGTTFLALARRKSQPPITKAQNALATHMSLHGLGLGLATAYLVGIGEGDSDEGDAAGWGLLALTGSVGGTVAGLAAGRRMTDAEAAASRLSADLWGLSAWGITSAAGMYEDDPGPGSNKVPVAIIAGSVIAGYALGPSYPRRASYNVTSGDVGTLWTTSALGAMAAYSVVSEADETETKSLALTAGMLGGAFIGDRLLVKPRDHGPGDGWLMMAGALGGGTIASGIVAAGEMEDGGALAVITLGATLGAIATEALLDPPRNGEIREASRTRAAPRTASVRGVTFEVDPVGAAFALSRRPGTFSVVRMTF